MPRDDIIYPGNAKRWLNLCAASSRQSTVNARDSTGDGREGGHSSQQRCLRFTFKGELLVLPNISGLHQDSWSWQESQQRLHINKGPVSRVLGRLEEWWGVPLLPTRDFCCPYRGLICYGPDNDTRGSWEEGSPEVQPQQRQNTLQTLLMRDVTTQKEAKP